MRQGLSARQSRRLYTLIQDLIWAFVGAGFCSINLAFAAAPDFRSTDPYKILGVNKTLPLSSIKRVYHQLAMQHHPDRGGREADIKAINFAWQAIQKKPEPEFVSDRPPNSAPTPPPRAPNGSRVLRASDILNASPLYRVFLERKLRPFELPGSWISIWATSPRRYFTAFPKRIGASGNLGCQAVTVAAGLCLCSGVESIAIMGTLLLVAQQFIFGPVDEYTQIAQPAAIAEQRFQQMLEIFRVRFDDISLGLIAYDLVDGLLNSESLPLRAQWRSYDGIQARLTELGRQFPEIRVGQLVRYLQNSPLLQGAKRDAYVAAMKANPNRARQDFERLRQAYPNQGTLSSLTRLELNLNKQTRMDSVVARWHVCANRACGALLAWKDAFTN